MKKLILTLAILMMSFGSAFAVPLFYNPTFGATGTWFEDDNLDYFLDLYDANGSLYTSEQQEALEFADRTIDVGDVLMSVVEFPFVNDKTTSTQYTLDTASDELVAISYIEVTSQTSNKWTFGEYNGMDMVSIYSGGSVNFSVDNDYDFSTQAAAIAEAGTFLWSFSIDDDEDTFWEFTPSGNVDPTSPFDVIALNWEATIGSVDFQLNQILGDPIFNEIYGQQRGNGDGLIEMRGDGELNAMGVDDFVNGAFATSDIDVFVNPVPEPSTMILLGVGLVGLAVARKRSKK